MRHLIGSFISVEKHYQLHPINRSVEVSDVCVPQGHRNSQSAPPHDSKERVIQIISIFRGTRLQARSHGNLSRYLQEDWSGLRTRASRCISFKKEMDGHRKPLSIWTQSPSTMFFIRRKFMSIGTEWVNCIFTREILRMQRYEFEKEKRKNRSMVWKERITPSCYYCPFRRETVMDWKRCSSSARRTVTTTSRLLRCCISESPSAA